MSKKLYILFTILLLAYNCASISSKSNTKASISVEKKAGFNAATKRVSTLSIYNLSKKKLNFKGDSASTLVGTTIDNKIGNIYGEEIVGGEAITTIASKLKLANFEKSVENLVEVGLNGGTLSPDAKKTLSTITEKGKIDSIAVPIVSNSSEALKSKEAITIAVVIFNGKSGDIELVGQNKDIRADKEYFDQLATKPDQAIATMNLFIIGKTNELMNEVRTVVKPGSKPSESSPASSETASADAPKKDETPLGKNPGFWGFMATILLFFALP